MRGVRIIGEKAGPAAGELRAIATAPGEIALGGLVIGGDQLRRLLEDALGGEDLGDGPADNVTGRNAQGGRGDRSLGVGLQLDEDAAGLVIGRRRVVEPCDDIRQRPAGHVGREHPAADGTGGQIARDRGQNLFQLVLGKARAGIVERPLQGRDMRRARVPFGTGLLIDVAQELQLGACELRDVDLDLVTEPQLLLERGEVRKGRRHGLDGRTFDLQLHRSSPDGSGVTTTPRSAGAPRQPWPATGDWRRARTPARRRRCRAGWSAHNPSAAGARTESSTAHRRCG